MHPHVIAAWLSEIPQLSPKTASSTRDEEEAATSAATAAAEHSLCADFPLLARRRQGQRHRKALQSISTQAPQLNIIGMPAKKRQRVGSPIKNTAIRRGDDGDEDEGGGGDGDGGSTGQENNELDQPSDDLDATPKASGSSVRLRISTFTNAMHQLPPTVGNNAQGLDYPIPNSSASSPQRKSTTSRKRSASPVKNMQHLNALSQTPVQWLKVRSMRCVQKIMELCPDQIEIVHRIADIAACNTPCIPAQVKRELDPVERFDCIDSDFTADKADVAGGCNDENSDAKAAFQLLYELEVLREIVDSTENCDVGGSCEPAWNEEVHSPLLRLAVKNLDHVRAVNFTRVPIDQAFLTSATTLSTSLLSAGTSQSATSNMGTRMIDYAMILQFPLHYPLRRQMTSFLHSQCSPPWNPTTINPTTNEGLWDSPVGVLVETKADSGTVSMGRTQLGLWARAWFMRFAMLRPSSPMQPCILPIIIVMSDSWTCYFACHFQGEIDIIGGLCLGSTTSLRGAYCILAALRELGRWVNRDFRAWIEQLVGYQEEEEEEEEEEESA